jgi:hypothetical protein
LVKELDNPLRRAARILVPSRVYPRHHRRAGVAAVQGAPAAARLPFSVDAVDANGRPHGGFLIRKRDLRIA